MAKPDLITRDHRARQVSSNQKNFRYYQHISYLACIHAGDSLGASSGFGEFKTRKARGVYYLVLRDGLEGLISGGVYQRLTRVSGLSKGGGKGGRTGRKARHERFYWIMSYIQILDVALIG